MDKENLEAKHTHLHKLQFGDLRRIEPISRSFGYDRGEPIDRYYIRKFLKENAHDIQGHVAEIGDDRYSREFGQGKIAQSDVLDQDHPDSNPTIVANLTSADHVPSNTFDCMIVIQTLQFIYDVQAALETVHRILKPGGIVLCSVPALSPICRYDMDRWGDYWRFTSAAVHKLFAHCFLPEKINIDSYGNVLIATAFLHGLAAEDLTEEELNAKDRDYEALITVRAVKGTK